MKNDGSIGPLRGGQDLFHRTGYPPLSIIWKWDRKRISATATFLGDHTSIRRALEAVDIPTGQFDDHMKDLSGRYEKWNAGIGDDEY